MAYNLIDERWIPVERRSGKLDLIAPAEVADREDPPVRVASPRPDFDGALLEFVVGLLQTAAAPARERGWEEWLQSPPKGGELKKRFDTVREAFFLDGDGPRFMQDLTVAKDPKASVNPIGALLIDRIGEEGLSQAPTLFAKPGGFDAFGYPAAAAALMTLQTYAPAGGRGQLTSLRGGGPLTTLIAGSDLWETAWLNVLPRAHFQESVPGDPEKQSAGGTFPWLAPTRIASKPTLPKAVHNLQHLWGLPRRVRLIFGDGKVGTCSVTGMTGVPVVSGYVNRPDGTSYEGDFRHPWTPYSEVKAGEPWNPKKGGPDGLPYRDWPLLVTGGERWQRAAVVSYFASKRRDQVTQPRLLAFGYAMDNMKPLRWCRAETPLITVAPRLNEPFAAAAAHLVAASEDVRRTLAGQLRSAWSDRPAGLEVFGRVNPAFWSATELAFFEAVHAARQAIEGGRLLDDVGEAWLAVLHGAAVRLFDAFVDAAAVLAPPELGRTVMARRDLVRFTHPSSRKLRKMLGLPVEEGASGARKTMPKPRKESKR
jgi:CRISPR system Cascade subunit CasA